MKISYKKLWMLLIQKDITKVQLRKDLGIAPGTMSKLNKGEEVAMSVLLRICEYPDCDIGDIYEVVRPTKEQEEIWDSFKRSLISIKRKFKNETLLVMI